MCEVCLNLEGRIARARRFATEAFDPVTKERLQQMLQELEEDLRNHLVVCKQK